MKPDERFVEEARELLKDIDRHGVGLPLPSNYMSTHKKDFVEFVAISLSNSHDQGRRDENEACAKVACHHSIDFQNTVERDCCASAKAIRQRIPKGEGVCD